MLTDIPSVILRTSNHEEDIQYCNSFGIEGYDRKPGPVSKLGRINFADKVKNVIH